MPILTVSIGNDGPIVSLGIAVSGPRQKALVAAGQTVPQAVIVRGLLDTGASCTAVDPQVIHALGLSPTGSVPIVTPSTGASTHLCDQYDVAVAVLMQPPAFHLATVTLPVIESELSHQGIQVLIGRDLLKAGTVFYNGPAGTMALAF